MEAHRRFAQRQNRRPGRGSSMMLAYASREGGGEERPEVFEQRTRFWWQPPDRLREEVESTTPEHARTTVVDGALWWTYTPYAGATTNADLDEEERGRHGVGGGERFRQLLDPSGLLAVLEIDEVADAGERIHLRARARDDVEQAHLHLSFLGLGADRCELELDRDTGIVRRLASFLDEREIALTELTELALDEDFPDGTFVFTPPPGVEVVSAAPQRDRHYTLEEAAAAAPFRVFFVPELPEGDWRLHVGYREARMRPPLPAHVLLMYHRADGRGALLVAQRPAGEGGFGWTGLGPPELETIERDGVTYTLSRGDRERGAQNAVVFEREGTAIQLQSQELDADTLLRLAASLAPAPTS